ncbi:hypothetical protein HMPREF9538_05378, partial [Klebsiella sp. MS 92-3]
KLQYVVDPYTRFKMANKLAILKDTYLIFTPLRRGATMPALNVGTLPNSPPPPPPAARGG